MVSNPLCQISTFASGPKPGKGCAYAKDRRSRSTSRDSEKQIKPSGEARRKDRLLLPFTPRGAGGRIETLHRRTVSRHGVRYPQGDSEILSSLSLSAGRRDFGLQYGLRLRPT